MAFHLAVDKDRLLADGRVERQCTLNSFARGELTAHHFHQRNQVWRIERMSKKDAFGMFGSVLNLTDQDARRTRNDQRTDRGCALELSDLRAILLNEVSLLD